MTRALIVGVGSHYGDDRAGWLILDRLQELGFHDCELRRVSNPADILDFMEQRQRLVICDACQGAGQPGSIHCWSWPTDRLLARHAHGTHDMGLSEVLELATGLGLNPSSVEIWAVEGQTWFPSLNAGAEVCAACEKAAAAIWEKYADA